MHFNAEGWGEFGDEKEDLGRTIIGLEFGFRGCWGRELVMSCVDNSMGK